MADSKSNQPKPNNKAGLITTLIVIAIFGIANIYTSNDEQVIDANNKALEISEAGGDIEKATALLEDAAENAVDVEVKISTLINLAYAYEDETKKLETFREALALADRDNAQYYLISGEIALLERKPQVALYNLNKANDLLPNDYQILNSLGLFYAGLDEYADDYVDYPKALSFFEQAYNDKNRGDFSEETLKENMGLVLFLMEEYDRSLEFLLSLNLENKDYANYFVGLAYLGKEDIDSSKKYLQRAKNMGYELEPELELFLNSDY